MSSMDPITERLRRALIDWYVYSGIQPQDITHTIRGKETAVELRAAIKEWFEMNAEKSA